jgi:glutamate/tyrosine decarboxylase-like PLP-dependent enzyme
VNEQLEDRLNRRGRLYLTHTSLAGRYVLRFCIGQTQTEERHVAAAWREIQAAAAGLEQEAEHDRGG